MVFAKPMKVPWNFKLMWLMTHEILSRPWKIGALQRIMKYQWNLKWKNLWPMRSSFTGKKKKMEKITKWGFMGHNISMKCKATLHDPWRCTIISRFELIINFPWKYFTINYPWIVSYTFLGPLKYLYSGRNNEFLHDC